MEFLDKLVLPQSSEHIQLLHYMMMLVLFMYIPFVGMLTGGLSLSLYFKRRGRITNDPKYLALSYDIIKLVTVKKTAGILLAIIPPFVLTFIFAQLLHQMKIAAVGYLFFGSLVGLPAVILVYIYRYSLEFKGLLGSVKSNEEVDSYLSSAGNLIKFAGPWGLFMMISSSYFVVAGISLGIYSNEWEASKNLLHIFVSGSFFIKWLYLFALGFAATASLMLFKVFYWDGGLTEATDEYKEFARELLSKIAMFAALSLPLLILIHVVQIPGQSLSKSTLIYAALSALLVFGLYHAIYQVVQNKNLNATSWALLFLLFSTISLIIADQSAFKQSTKLHSIVLAAEHDSS